MLSEFENVRNIGIFEWFRHLRVDVTEKVFEINENWVLHENWVRWTLSTTTVLVSMVVWVWEYLELCSDIVAGREFDATVLESACNSAV